MFSTFIHIYMFNIFIMKTVCIFKLNMQELNFGFIISLTHFENEKTEISIFLKSLTTDSQINI